MRSGKISYFISEGVHNSLKNGWMTLASVGVLVACLLIMETFLSLSLNISHIIETVSEENEIVVFLDEDLTDEQVAAVGDQIRALEGVRQTVFTDRNKAFEEYKENATWDSNSLLDSMENPIRNSYSIFLTDIGLMSQVMDELKGVDGIATIRGREDVSEKLVQLKRVLSVVMLWFFAVLLGVSLFIIANTVKLAMFARRKEINIMKYVGATDGFIRGPFLVEGVLIALLGSSIAWVMQRYLYLYIVQKVFAGVSFLELLSFSSMSLLLALCCIGGGLVVGVFGSVISIRKYLHV